MAFDKDKFINEIKEMKVAELNELVKAIEEEFGVTAAAPMAAAAGDSAESADKNLVLKSAGASKVAVIKVVREVLGLGLMEAKAFAEGGGVIKEAASPEEIEEISAKFKEAGAEVAVE
jgi:large subunit ribosomal protein L7/L12